MDSEKGQVTIFVVVGILLVASVVVVYFLNSSRDYVVYKEGYVPAVDEVKGFMDSCLDDSVGMSLDWAFLNGGYYLPSDEMFILYEGDDISESGYVPIYYDLHSGNNIPSLAFLEDEFSNIFSEHARECLSSLQMFEKDDIVVNYDFDDANIETKIADGGVSVKMDLDVFVSVDDTKYLLNDFEASSASNYFGLYGVASDLSALQNEFDDYICLSCIDDLAGERGVRVHVGDGFLKDEKYVVVYDISKFSEERNKTELFRIAHAFYDE